MSPANAPAQTNGPSWSAIQYVISLLVPLVVSGVVAFAGYKVLEYRVDLLETSMKEARAQRDADHEFLLKVAGDLKLFLCKNDHAYCQQ